MHRSKQGTRTLEKQISISSIVHSNKSAPTDYTQTSLTVKRMSNLARCPSTTGDCIGAELGILPSFNCTITMRWCQIAKLIASVHINMPLNVIGRMGVYDTSRSPVSLLVSSKKLTLSHMFRTAKRTTASFSSSTTSVGISFIPSESVGCRRKVKHYSNKKASQEDWKATTLYN